MNLFEKFESIDRRVIYAFVLLSLSLPLMLGMKLQPAEMETARRFYEQIEKLEIQPGEVVLIAVDWGPNTQAENKPQTEVAIEHLMRRNIPFLLITNYALATPFMESIPKDVASKLMQEDPSRSLKYGQDWVNIGYRPGSFTMIEGLAKSNNLASLWKTDAFGTPVEQLPALKGVETIKDIPMLMQFTGLTGLFNYWLQFFFAEGHSPVFLHGCTSITIPDAHIYLASEQIRGLHEGIAGAAWHEQLLQEAFPSRSFDYSWRVNTGLAYAHIVILLFMLLGNVGLISRGLR